MNICHDVRVHVAVHRDVVALVAAPGDLVVEGRGALLGRGQGKGLQGQSQGVDAGRVGSEIGEVTCETRDNKEIILAMNN